MFGPLEILVILIVAVIVFAPKRLPELGEGLARALREFRHAVSGEEPGEEKRLESSKTSASAGEERPEREVVSDKRA
ncbi:MAG TPA: twin-arginine translocase TatA/TatE family subunit [Solirubrobacterales bacterium]|nr:twin-arginine translocase TatA/TatE family subunit [Solirubrobacterales bacterium]